MLFQRARGTGQSMARRPLLLIAWCQYKRRYRAASLTAFAVHKRHEPRGLSFCDQAGLAMWEFLWTKKNAEERSPGKYSSMYDGLHSSSGKFREKERAPRSTKEALMCQSTRTPSLTSPFFCLSCSLDSKFGRKCWIYRHFQPFIVSNNEEAQFLSTGTARRFPDFSGISELTGYLNLIPKWFILTLYKNIIITAKLFGRIGGKDNFKTNFLFLTNVSEESILLRLEVNFFLNKIKKN